VCLTDGLWRTRAAAAWSIVDLRQVLVHESVHVTVYVLTPCKLGVLHAGKTLSIFTKASVSLAIVVLAAAFSALLTMSGGVAVSQTERPLTGNHQQQENQGQRESWRGKMGIALDILTKQSRVGSIHPVPGRGTDSQVGMHASLLAREQVAGTPVYKVRA